MKIKYKCTSCAEMWYTKEEAELCCTKTIYYDKKADKGIDTSKIYKCQTCGKMFSTVYGSEMCCNKETLASEPLPDTDYYAKKLDLGKLQHSLIDPEFIRGLAEVMTYGAEKYSADSWKTIPDAKERYENAMLRHINAWQRGSKADAESEIHHLLHASVNAMFLMWFERNADDGKTI